MALVVEYEGTRYAGFQVQPGRLTIQGELERALAALTGSDTRVYAASRTDAGTHACGQVVAFWTRASYEGQTFVQGTNSYLPSDIRVQAAYGVSGTFDPRRDAYAREYHYRILRRPAPSALLRRYAYHVPLTLDLGALQEAGRYLQGTRDFAPFSGKPGNGGTVRRLDRVEVKEDGDLVTVEMVGNAFLPQQVRRIVGTLVRVGTGRLSLKEFRLLADRRQRGVAGPTAPASGLYLVGVWYPNFPPRATAPNLRGLYV